MAAPSFWTDWPLYAALAWVQRKFQIGFFLGCAVGMLLALLMAQVSQASAMALGKTAIAPRYPVRAPFAETPRTVVQEVLDVVAYRVGIDAEHVGHLAHGEPRLLVSKLKLHARPAIACVDQQRGAIATLH